MRLRMPGPTFFTIALCVATLVCSGALAQDAGPQVTGRGAFGDMQRVTGEVTAIAPDSVTVKGEDGAAYKVVTTANTRMFKGQGVPLKISDLKVGDGMMAAGNLDAPNKTLHAALVFVTDAEAVKKLKENLGKTFIAGKITAIDVDNAKLTVLRADGVSQVISADDSTSFKRGRGRGGNGMTTYITNGGGAGQAAAARCERRRRKHHDGRHQSRRPGRGPGSDEGRRVCADRP